MKTTFPYWSTASNSNLDARLATHLLTVIEDINH